MRILQQWGTKSPMPCDEGKAVAPQVRRPASSIAAMATQFGREDRGAVAMVFGLMVIPCIMLVGFSVDFGRMIAVKTQTQNIVDNAALAAAKAAQSVTSNFATAGQAAATDYWNAHKSQISHTVSTASAVEFSSDAAQSQFTLKVINWVPTPFLTSGEMIVPKTADAAAPASCKPSAWLCQRVVTEATAKLQSGGNNQNTNIEMSVMLDVTGSMDGQKILDLKAATHDLLDIIVWQNQSVVKSRVALVPFAQGVNVGTTMGPLVYGPVTSGTCATNTSGCNSFKFTKQGGSGSRTYKLSKSCVTERANSAKYTDATPSSSPVGKAYLEDDGGCSLVNDDDAEVNLFTPLTSNKQMLHDRVDKLTIAGSTAGQIGTAWAWYALAPGWGYLYPNASQPAAYTDASTKKYAVLMTDGDYNTQYCKGAEAKDSYNAKINCNGSGGEAETMAAALCTSMKAKGIVVYTVGFQTSNVARAFLQACATSNSHYYDTTTGDALRLAFRDIALKVSSIVLNK